MQARRKRSSSSKIEQTCRMVWPRQLAGIGRWVLFEAIVQQYSREIRQSVGALDSVVKMHIAFLLPAIECSVRFCEHGFHIGNGLRP